MLAVIAISANVGSSWLEGLVLKDYALLLDDTSRVTLGYKLVLSVWHIVLLVFKKSGKRRSLYWLG